MSTRNTDAIAQRGPRTATEIARINPITSPPTIAPGTLPIPPSTAAVSAYNPS